MANPKTIDQSSEFRRAAEQLESLQKGLENNRVVDAYGEMYDARDKKLSWNDFETAYYGSTQRSEPLFYFNQAPIFSRAVFGIDAGEPASPPPPAVDPVKLNKLRSVEPRKVEVESRAPDYMQVITGWRVWGVNGGRLTAVAQETTWEPKTALNALCEGARSHAGSAPQRGCNCGVWAFKTLELLVAGLNRDGMTNLEVFGQVALWGRVIETEFGYRAEKAYPTELWLMKPGFEDLGRIYDVPVRTL